MWVGWGIWLEAKNIDRGRGYGIFFEMRLGTMKEVWFTNRLVLCSLPTMISIAPSDR